MKSNAKQRASKNAGENNQANSEATHALPTKPGRLMIKLLSSESRLALSTIVDHVSVLTNG